MALFDHSEEPQNLQVDEVGKAYLLESARWGTFLGIMGFIGTGFLFLIGLLVLLVGSASTMGKLYGSSSPIGMGFLGFIYMVMALAYFYPALMLFNFSSGIKRSFAINDQDAFIIALQKLRNLIKYKGIFMIAMILLYVLIIIFIIVAAVVANL